MEQVHVVGGISEAEKDAGVADWMSSASEQIGLQPLSKSPILNMVGMAPEGAARATGLNRPAVRVHAIDGGADVPRRAGPAVAGDFNRPVMSAGVRAKLPGYGAGARANLGPIVFKK